MSSEAQGSYALGNIPIFIYRENAAYNPDCPIARNSHDVGCFLAWRPKLALHALATRVTGLFTVFCVFLTTGHTVNGYKFIHGMKGGKEQGEGRMPLTSNL